MNVADAIEVYYEVTGEDAAAVAFLVSAVTDCVDVIVSVLRTTPFNGVAALPEVHEEIIKEASEVNGATITLTITKPTALSTEDVSVTV